MNARAPVVGGPSLLHGRPPLDAPAEARADLISVIIPAYNAADTIGACLDALEHQSVPRACYELIVVDDGSTDGTAAAATRPGVLVLRHPHTSAAAARNHGVCTSHGALLLFTDADCAPAPDWIARMRAAFADPDVIGTKGVYRTHQPELVARFVQIEYEDKYDRLRRYPMIDFIDTYSAGYRRAPFLAAGGFDPEIHFAEDQEFSFRLAAAGAKLVFTPTAVVGHRHAATLSDYARKKFYGGYWKFRVASRHTSKFVSDSHTPPVMKVQMGLVALAALLAPFSLWSPRIARVLALLGLTFLASTVPFMRKAWRKDRQVARVAPAILLVRAAAGDVGVAWSFLQAIRTRLLRTP